MTRDKRPRKNSRRRVLCLLLGIVVVIAVMFLGRLQNRVARCEKAESLGCQLDWCRGTKRSADSWEDVALHPPNALLGFSESVGDDEFIEICSLVESFGIVCVNMRNASTSDAAFLALRKLDCIEFLTIGSGANKNGLETISTLSTLRSLTISDKQIRSVDLELLVRLENLEDLLLHGTKLSKNEAMRVSNQLPGCAVFLDEGVAIDGKWSEARGEDNGEGLGKI